MLELKGLLELIRPKHDDDHAATYTPASTQSVMVGRRELTAHSHSLCGVDLDAANAA